MRPEPKVLWESDDVSLHQEFSDVSDTWQLNKPKSASVPSALDRKIRSQAGAGIERDLADSWIFGAVPKLSMAALILFGVGIMFVSSLDLNSKPEGSLTPTIGSGLETSRLISGSGVIPIESLEEMQQSSTTLDRVDIADYEIEFQFTLDGESKAIDAEIIARCQFHSAGDCSELEALNTARVDSIARMMLKRRTFEANTTTAKVFVSQNRLMQE